MVRLGAGVLSLVVSTVRAAFTQRLSQVCSAGSCFLVGGSVMRFVVKVMTWRPGL